MARRLRASSGTACVVIAQVVLGGCAATNPRADYDRAEALVRDRTGVEQTYRPDGEPDAAATVDGLLAGGLTVEEAAQVALLNNPEFASAISEIGASRADLAQSALLSNPTLSLGLQLPEGGGLADFTVGFAQQVADLWQIPVRKRMAQADLDRVVLAVGQRAVELVSDVRARCYRVMALKQAVAFGEEDLELLQRAVDLTEMQMRAGEVGAAEVSLARVGVIDVQEQLISLRGQLEQARIDLAQTLGLSTRCSEVEVTDGLEDPLHDPPAAEALIDLALDQRFDVRAAWLGVARAEAALQLECRRWLPDVQLGLGFERNELRAMPGRKLLADTARSSIAAGALTAPSIESRGQRALAREDIIEAKLGPTLALALPVFDQNQEQIAKARVRVLQARQTYAARVEAVIADVLRAVSAMRSAEQLLQFQRAQGLPAAQATLDIVRQQQRAGELGVLALIESQDSLVRRRGAYVNALRDYATALAALESAVGGRSVLARAPAASTSQPATQETPE